MTERKLKCLVLFLLESILIQGGRILTQDFAEQFNNFIYEQYEKDRESLSILFNIDMLSKFIDGKYDILTLPQIMELIYRYQGTENYVKLVEEIGIEDDKKINDLALLFLMYYQNIIKLYYDDDSMYYPKGYPRIKQ